MFVQSHIQQSRHHHRHIASSVTRPTAGKVSRAIQKSSCKSSGVGNGLTGGKIQSKCEQSDQSKDRIIGRNHAHPPAERLLSTTSNKSKYNNQSSPREVKKQVTAEDHRIINLKSLRVERKNEQASRCDQPECLKSVDQYTVCNINKFSNNECWLQEQTDDSLALGGDAMNGSNAQVARINSAHKVDEGVKLSTNNGGWMSLSLRLSGQSTTKLEQSAQNQSGLDNWQSIDHPSDCLVSAKVEPAGRVLSKSESEIRPNSDIDDDTEQPSIIRSSKRKFELISAFCSSFILYQLETLRLIAAGVNCDLDNSSHVSSSFRESCNCRRKSSSFSSGLSCANQHESSSAGRKRSKYSKQVSLDEETMFKAPPDFNSLCANSTSTFRNQTAGVSHSHRLDHHRHRHNHDHMNRKLLLDRRGDFGCLVEELSRNHALTGEDDPIDYFVTTIDQPAPPECTVERSHRRSRAQVDTCWPLEFSNTTESRGRQIFSPAVKSVPPPVKISQEAASLAVSCHGQSPLPCGSLTKQKSIQVPLSTNNSLEYSLEEPISLPLSNVDNRNGMPDPYVNVGSLDNNGHCKSYQRYEQRNYIETETHYQSTKYHQHIEQYPTHSKQKADLITNNYDRNSTKSRQNPTINGQHCAQVSTKLMVGSDSELYSRYNNQNQHILPTTNRAYHIHNYSSKVQVGLPIAATNHQSAPIYFGLNTTTEISNEAQVNRSPVNQNSDKSQQLSTKSIVRVRKSNISSKLSLAGARRRLGFKQKGLSSLSVQRSEEIVPDELARHLVRQLTATDSFTDSGNESGSHWFNRSQRTQNSQDPRACFVEGLGAGQIVSRQALVSPYLGDVQLSLSDRRGMLEVEVIRARALQPKASAKILPSPYVKVYLMKNKKCMAKCKTTPAISTLDPLYQQQFIFREDYTNCVLQVIVWGDYGKKDRKSLMGIVQIHLNDLDISNLIICWYKLFNAPSMINSMLSSKALRQTLLSRSLRQDSLNVDGEEATNNKNERIYLTE